jgi:hypothetical protein
LALLYAKVKVPQAKVGNAVTMTNQQAAAEFFRRDFAAWNAHNVDAAVAVTTEDVRGRGMRGQDPPPDGRRRTS